MRLELDCASTMFILGRNKRRNYLIRLSVTLYEPIEKEILQIALKKTVENYPWFFIRFVHYQNCLFAEQAKNIPEVREKKDVFRLNLWKNHENCEAQVTYSKSTIFLEFFHAVSDGKGGMEFLIHLTAEYLSLRYNNDKIIQNLPIISNDKQIENGYQKYAKGFQTKKSYGAAFRIKGTPAQTEISIYRLSVYEIKQMAKKYEVSITVFMSALLSMALSNIQKESYTKYKQRKIRLLIPVNLRNLFHCNTIRNFTLNVCPEMEPEKDSDISQICNKFNKYMKSATQTVQLAGQCAAATKICDFGIVKTLPISIRKWLVQAMLDLPFTGSSMTFSNMGAVLLPTEMVVHVKKFEMAFSAKPDAPYSCAAISMNDEMNLTFLRTIKEPTLEKHFENLLNNLKIRFEKTTNCLTGGN